MMFRYLQIYDPRERALVGLADLALRPMGWFGSSRRPAGRPVRRVLLLRLERIGDLLMALDAIDDAKRAWPDAEIDLAVGSWNEPLARLIPGIGRIDVADAPWLTREESGHTWSELLGIARRWRSRRYDVVVNFEPDIRSNVLAWVAGGARRVGYSSGGGGALLTDAVPYAPLEHVSTNARRAIARAAPGAVAAGRRAPRLAPPPPAVASARALLGGARRPLVGVHASGGRESKQWHLDRFAAVARAIAASHDATIVLTGAATDRPLVDAVRAGLRDASVIDACGRADLPVLAALLGELDLLVTGDTGPMHLAAAMDTPLIALFGPSDPRRYGPQSPVQHVLRVDLPCSPCGRVRLPPHRCRGRVPECLDSIGVDRVVAAATDLLGRGRSGPV
jgi:ADP-heptose:LPS heptosyltransferase